MTWQIFPWIMECLKLPMLKFGQIFVPHKIFEIIFSYESYIQTKTYQSFEYAQSTKNYICCRFPQSYSHKYRKWNLMFRAISSQIGEKHPFGIYELSLCLMDFVCFSPWFNQWPGILKTDRLSRQWDQLNN